MLEYIKVVYKDDVNLIIDGNNSFYKTNETVPIEAGQHTIGLDGINGTKKINLQPGETDTDNPKEITFP